VLQRVRVEEIKLLMATWFAFAALIFASVI